MALREIIFRGKRLDNGEWVEGDLLENDNYSFPMKMIGRVIMSRDKQTNELSFDGFDLCEVDPSTVGQFTGLLDKNGKRIFEGDIVVKRTYNGNKNFAVSFGGGMFHCGYGGGSSTPTHRYTLEDKQIRVIGNIQDNPELLKGGEDG